MPLSVHIILASSAGGKADGTSETAWDAALMGRGSATGTWAVAGVTRVGRNGHDGIAAAAHEALEQGGASCRVVLLGFSAGSRKSLKAAKLLAGEARVVATIAAAFPAVDPKLKSRLGELDGAFPHPVLLLMGAKDVYTSARRGADIPAQVAAKVAAMPAKSRVVLIGGHGHNLEPARAECVARIVDFLTGVI